MDATNLRFVRDYLERHGAKLPLVAYGEEAKPSPCCPGHGLGHEHGDMEDVESDDDMSGLDEKSMPPKTYEDENVTDDESDLELDNEGVVEADDEPPQKMGDQNVKVTKEKMDEAKLLKAKAIEAMGEGKLDEALGHFTEAIICNPNSAILFANRAGLYVKMKKPNAAIRDADAAIKINPDSAKGYKWRGEAKALLGQWEESAKDLRLACRLDSYRRYISTMEKTSNRAAAEMGCSTVGLSSRRSPLLTYKRRKRDSTFTRTQSPLSGASDEEEDEHSLSESEWPSFSHLRLATPEQVDTAGSCHGAVQVVRTIPEPKRTVAPLSAKRSRQLFLDLGQADFTHTTCRTCGLVYARGLESDEKIHNSFHRSQLKGISFKGWIGERVAHQASSAGDRVIYVLPGDPPSHLGKVREVVKVMEQEMGLAPGWLWQKQRCKVYLFISASKKIVGCVVAERVESAFPIVPHEQDDSKASVTHVRASSNLDSSANRLQLSKEKPKSSTQLLWGGWKFTREVVNRKKAQTDNQQDLGRAILCSKTGVPAVCGVRGIWVSRSERRKGVASHLLDAMRKTFCLGMTLEALQCAFSQPSPDGEAFAARYCGTSSFLVYQSPLQTKVDSHLGDGHIR